MFADFSKNPAGNFYLVRISFDGYGCCHPANGVTTMSVDDSRSLATAIAIGRVETAEIRRILVRYFDENINQIWPDAVVEYGLHSD